MMLISSCILTSGMDLEIIKNLFQDKQLLRALQNTGFFALVVVPVQTIIALVIAYILASKGIKAKKMFRLIYFLPTLIFKCRFDIDFHVCL